jgi:hypothetical protein
MSVSAGIAADNSLSRILASVRLQSHDLSYLADSVTRSSRTERLGKTSRMSKFYISVLENTNL